MAYLANEITIEGSRGMPTMGMLNGSRISYDVIDIINQTGYKSFFGSEVEHMTQDFFNRHVRDMDRVHASIAREVNLIINPDVIRPLTTLKDFEAIPTSMEMPILLFEPVRQLLNEGRVSGWGFDPATLPEDDVYGRMISNFSCDDVGAAMNEDGWYPVSATMWSDDPDLSSDELYDINSTREYIVNHILANTDLDPTEIDMPRG